MIDLSQAQYRKATRSNGADTGCVEIATNLPGVVAVRDSTRPEAGSHLVTKDAFTAFLNDVKAGRYDL